MSRPRRLIAGLIAAVAAASLLASGLSPGEALEIGPGVYPTAGSTPQPQRSDATVVLVQNTVQPAPAAPSSKPLVPPMAPGITHPSLPNPGVQSTPGRAQPGLAVPGSNPKAVPGGTSRSDGASESRPELPPSSNRARPAPSSPFNLGSPTLPGGIGAYGNSVAAPYGSAEALRPMPGVGGYGGYGYSGGSTGGVGGHGSPAPVSPFEAGVPAGATQGPQASTIGGAPSSMQPAVSQKPFSDFSPRPIISPYMELYRTRTVDDFVGINRYYTYVRPRIEQEQRNREVRRQFRRLQDINRQQQSKIQDLRQQTQHLEGRPQQQYFMNQGQYYHPPAPTQQYEPPTYRPPVYQPPNTRSPYR